MRKLLNTASSTTLRWSLIILLIMLVPFMHKRWIRSYVGNKVVKLIGMGGLGTGFHITAPSGKTYILTNFHVCWLADKEKKMLAVSNHGVQKVKVIKRSTFTDLCLLTPMKEHTGLTLSIPPYSNQHVAVIGHPYGLQQTLSEGNVIGPNQAKLLFGYIDIHIKEKECKGPMFEIIPVSMFDQGRRQFEFIPFLEEERLIANTPEVVQQQRGCVMTVANYMTNVQVLGGNSGSPVVDFYGNLVGVVFASYGEASWMAMVRIQDVKKFLERY